MPKEEEKCKKGELTIKSKSPTGEDRMLEIWNDAKALAEIKKIFCPDLTDVEFSTFVGIGRTTGLNPFLREIWAIKYGNKVAIFVGRDGYRKRAQQDINYDYHIADAIYSNDEFYVENGEVKHKYFIKNRGELIGGYAIVKRKNASKPMFNYVSLEEYYKGHKNADGSVKMLPGKGGTQYEMKPTNWDTMPATMIKKVAESQCLRMSFQEVFAGTYDESEKWEIEGEAQNEKGNTTTIYKKKEVQAPPCSTPVDKQEKDIKEIFEGEIVADSSMEMITEKQIEEIKNIQEKLEMNDDLLSVGLQANFKKQFLNDLTQKEGNTLIKKLNDKLK